MTDSAKENKRHGIRVPRSTLLPPYLSLNPYFVEYTDAIDAVFGPNVDDKLNVMQNIRNMWVQNSTTEFYVETQEIVPKDAWSFPDRDLIVKQVNMLGMKLQNAGVVSDDAYQTIARFVGMYWFGKGTYSFIDFINYCLSSDLRVYNMWTRNYKDFYKEGDSHIGVPIWDGGPWYPTTHVTIVAKGGLQGLDIRTLQSFFYEIANYNLVLLAIDSNFDMYIVPTKEDRSSFLPAIAGVGINSFVIANFKNRGAPPPPTFETEQLPTTYYAMNGVPADFNTAFLLAQPTGWIYLDGGQKVPYYGPPAQLLTDQANIGVKLLGRAIPSNEFDLLYGPIQWAPIPGTNPGRVGSRLPYYTTSAFTIVHDETMVSARAVGVNRTKLLMNPVGFFEINPGQFVPYW